MPLNMLKSLIIILSSCLFAGATLAEKTLYRGNGAEPDSLDPHYVEGTWESNIVGEMFEGLMTEASNGAVIPGMATGYEVSEDGRRYTFTLREGAVWSDGVPVQASDFVYSLRRILDPMTAARYASLIYVIKGAKEVNIGQAEPEALGVSAPDPRTLVIDLAYPAPYLPELSTHQTMSPVPPHVVKKHGKAWIRPENLVANGPFTLEDWTPNASITLVRNPSYYAADTVALDKVVFYPVADANVALSQFRAGKLDMNITSGSGFPARQIEWLNENLPGQARIHPYMSTAYITLNLEKPPFDDVRVRRALSLALDRTLFTKRILRDGTPPAYAFVPPSMPNYQDGVTLDFINTPMEERLDEARRLLAEAGYGPDNPLRFEYRYMTSGEAKRAAVAFAGMWRRIGAIADIVASEPKVHYKDLQSGNFQAARAGWVADYADAQNFLYLLLSSSEGMNYGRYRNPEFDALMDRANVTVDIAQRAALMAQAEQLMLDDVALIPTDNSVTRSLVAPHVIGYVDNVKNVHRNRFLDVKR